MAEKMPQTPLQRIELLEDAIKQGLLARQMYRRRANPGEVARQVALKQAIERINMAQALVRSDLGRLQWNVGMERELGDRMREASRRGQLERRKLRKMLR